MWRWFSYSPSHLGLHEQYIAYGLYESHQTQKQAHVVTVAKSLNNVQESVISAWAREMIQ